jgi:hypothetical protein
MRKGFIIYEEMHNYFPIPIYMKMPQSYMTLQLLPLNFLAYEKNFLFFFIRARSDLSLSLSASCVLRQMMRLRSSTGGGGGGAARRPPGGFGGNGGRGEEGDEEEHDWSSLASSWGVGGATKLIFFNNLAKDEISRRENNYFTGIFAKFQCQRLVWLKRGIVVLFSRELAHNLTLSHMAYFVLFVTWPGVHLDPPI